MSESGRHLIRHFVTPSRHLPFYQFSNSPLKNTIEMKAFQHFEPPQAIPKNQPCMGKILGVIILKMNKKRAECFVCAVAILITARKRDTAGNPPLQRGVLP